MTSVDSTEYPRERKERKHHSVYHPLKNETDNFMQFHVYSKSGSADSANDYKKRSLSDDYKRRSYMDAEKYHDANQSEDAAKFSPECYVLSLAITSVMIVMLILLLVYVSELPYLPEIFDIPRYQSLERRYKVFVAMTENLDCSLYIKNLAAKHKLSKHALMRSGILCISTMVPYSAAGFYSTSSMMVYRRLTPDGMVKSALVTGVYSFVESHSNLSTEYHHFESFRDFRNSYVLQESTNPQPISKFWVENITASEKRQMTDEWNRMDSEGNITNPRQFYVTTSLAKWLNASETPEKMRWLEEVGLASTTNYTEQVLKPPIADVNSKLFLLSAPGGELADYSVRYSHLYLDRHSASFFYYKAMEAMIPKSTNQIDVSSIFSAFVTSLTTKCFNHRLFESLVPISREVYITYLILRSQQLAYELLPETEEWNKNPSLPSLLSKEMLQRAEKIILSKNFTVKSRIRKKKFDRVTNIAYFSMSRYQEVAMTFSMSREIPFGVIPPSNGSITTISPFYNIETGEQSRIFTSAAEMILLREHKDGKATLRFLIAASGSVRTVGAVSSVAVKMLIEQKGPGRSIKEPSGYYDPRDGRFYCEHNGVILKGLYNDYGINCSPVPSEDFEATDNFVTAIRIREDKYKQALAAVTQRPDEVNYAVGF